MTAPASPAPSPPARTQQLVLLGAGHAHLQVLIQLAAQPLPGTAVILVTPHPGQLHSNMVPGFAAGHYTLDNCTTALEPLVQRSGIRWIQRSAIGVDAQNQSIQLDDGSTLPFDWLSVNTGTVQDRDKLERNMPGAREHGLFLRPVEAFCALWPRVVELGNTRPLRIAVLGTDAAGVELALATRHRLPSAAVTLVCGKEPPGANFPPAVQHRLLAVLKKRKVTLLQDVALSLTAQAIQLGCGADLACDVPLLATRTLAPSWLAGSGLALDAQGFLAVDMYQRSTSHSRVFAAGGVSKRADHPLARGSAHSARAGTSLAFNLAAAITGAALKPYKPSGRHLHLLSCGGKYAVASWGGFSAQGRWVWWLKNWMDRRFVARFSRAG